MISGISPWDELDPPETDTVMMNSKGAVVMNSVTLAKIASGQIPIKFDRLIDVDRMEEIVMYCRIWQSNVSTDDSCSYGEKQVTGKLESVEKATSEGEESTMDQPKIKLYIPLNQYTVERINRLHKNDCGDYFDEEWLYNELEQIAEIHQLSEETSTNTPTDLISRQAAIDALGEEPDIAQDTDEEWAERDTWVRHVRAIESLQPVEDMGEVSDGYHTFNQLYHQRAVLFATIVNQNKDKAWKSWKHEDGKFCFDKEGEWFIVGVDTPEGSYTYHYEKKYWDMFDCEELDMGKHWDGHTEEDVTRLLSLPPVEPVAKNATPTEDCISRKAAIEALMGHFVPQTYTGEQVERAEKLAQKIINAVPSVEPKPVCEDAISRADTLKALCAECDLSCLDGTNKEAFCTEYAMIKSMPSVESKRPKTTETMMVDGEPTEIDPLSYEVGYSHGQTERPKGKWIPVRKVYITNEADFPGTHAAFVKKSRVLLETLIESLHFWRRLCPFICNGCAVCPGTKNRSKSTKNRSKSTKNRSRVATINCAASCLYVLQLLIFSAGLFQMLLLFSCNFQSSHRMGNRNRTRQC